MIITILFLVDIAPPYSLQTNIFCRDLLDFLLPNRFLQFNRGMRIVSLLKLIRFGIYQNK